MYYRDEDGFGMTDDDEINLEGAIDKKGGKLGRKVGSVKTEEQMKAECREVISLLRKGVSIREVAKLSGKGVSTVQRVKRMFKVQLQ